MTLDEAKEAFALKNGYVGWHEIVDDHKVELVCDEFAKFCLEIKEDNLEKLGLLKDKIDNLLGALQLPMPPAFHVEQMKRELKGVSDEIMELYIDEGGETDWD